MGIPQRRVPPAAYVGTVQPRKNSRALHRRTLMNGSGSSLISQDSTARGNLFFGKKIPLSSHLQLPVTVTVIFSRQPILMRFSPLSFMRCQHFSRTSFVGGENNVKIQQIRQLFESVCKFQSLQLATKPLFFKVHQAGQVCLWKQLFFGSSQF